MTLVPSVVDDVLIFRNILDKHAYIIVSLNTQKAVLNGKFCFCDIDLTDFLPSLLDQIDPQIHTLSKAIFRVGHIITRTL